jgi:3-methyladenine DNA glycosylase Tag
LTASFHNLEAARRNGGATALEAKLKKPLPPAEIAKTTDDRWLAAMAKCLFQAGFKWQVVEAKWKGFEEAFEGFDPTRVAAFGDEDVERMMVGTLVVRNASKLMSVIDNARFVTELAREHGSAGAFFASWPMSDFVGLLNLMGKRGSRLGGVAGQRTLRDMGCDGFVLSRFVSTRLVAEGVISDLTIRKADLYAIQKAFDTWAEQSGRSFTEISQVLAQDL